MMVKNLTCKVVEYTSYDDKIVHIENVSYDMALFLVNMMNERWDTYLTVEDMDDETT